MDIQGVLAGLGNPGSKYEGTRHNTGFAFAETLLDYARKEGEVQSLSGSRFECELWRVELNELKGQWLVCLPQTYMNLSGAAVQPLLAWYRIEPSSLVVAHDELDIPAGLLRFKLGGGNAGHNGLKSITERLGTPDFMRLRLGIGRPQAREDVTGWVLSRPRPEDRERMEAANKAGLKVLFTLARRGLKAAEQMARDEERRLKKSMADAAKKAAEAVEKNSQNIPQD